MFEKTCRIGDVVMIGYSPEHDARQIWFDLSKWLNMWPGSTPIMMVLRPGESEAYRAETKMDGTQLVWTVRRYDTKIPGIGEMWVVFRRDGDDLVGITPSTSITIRRGPPGIPTRDRR